MGSLISKLKEQIVTREFQIISMILVFASLNDLLRIPGTVISFYRIIFPLAIFIIFINRHLLKQDFVYLALMFVSITIQEILYSSVFYPDDSVTLAWRGKYIILYICIWSIFPLVRIIKTKYYSVFNWMFEEGIIIASVFLLTLYVMSVVRVPDSLMNRNNYACCIAAVFPWLLISGCHQKKIIYEVIAVAFVCELIWGDSKAALMGILIQIGLFLSIRIARRFKWSLAVFGGMIFSLGGIWLYLLLNVDMVINGFHISEMFVDMVERIYSGNLNVGLYKSVEYRTNSIIYMLQAISESFPFGMGPGSTGRILSMKMPLYWNILGLNYVGDYLSPHNALLAFVSDSGWFALIFVFFMIRYIVKGIFNLKKLTSYGEYGLLFFSSFFMWNISASELFVVYFVFIIIAMIRESEEVRF